MLSVHAFMLQGYTVGHMNEPHQYADMLTRASIYVTALTFIWLPQLTPANINQHHCKRNILVKVPVLDRLIVLT